MKYNVKRPERAEVPRRTLGRCCTLAVRAVGAAIGLAACSASGTPRRASSPTVASLPSVDAGLIRELTIGVRPLPSVGCELLTTRRGTRSFTCAACPRR
jgi:hypothetical protein